MAIGRDVFDLCSQRRSTDTVMGFERNSATREEWRLMYWLVPLSSLVPVLPVWVSYVLISLLFPFWLTNVLHAIRDSNRVSLARDVAIKEELAIMLQPFRDKETGA